MLAQGVSPGSTLRMTLGAHGAQLHQHRNFTLIAPHRRLASGLVVTRGLRPGLTYAALAGLPQSCHSEERSDEESAS